MAAEPVTIRPIGVGDTAAVRAHLERHMAESGNGEPVFVPYEQGSGDMPAGCDPERLQRAIGKPGWQRWIGAFNDDDVLIGHVDLKGDTMASGVHRCTLGIGIERAFRGNGLGRRLMDAAIELCRDADGIDWLDLFVFAHNAPAVALYRKLGFREVGTVTDRFRLGGVSVDDVIMTLDVRRG